MVLGKKGVIMSDMRIDILTLFPEVCEPYIATSIVGRARQDGLVDIHLWNIRDFTEDKHKTVDDTPYGGGAGMVMKVEPIHKALQAIPNYREAYIAVMSARGKEFTQQKAVELSQRNHLILICGRYEGIDQRVADHLADEEISVGSYVVAGGELPALIIAEATIRLIPGVLGNPLSLATESHTTEGTIEAPQYTKPEEYNGWKVPDVLLSGNHEAIAAWRTTKPPV